MKIRTIALGGALILTATFVQAYAAGPYDGKWQGTSDPSGPCTGTATYSITIADNVLSGDVSSTTPTPQGYIRGTLIASSPIAADGTITVAVGQNTRYPAAFRFSKDTFTGTVNAACGQRSITGHRVP